MKAEETLDSRLQPCKLLSEQDTVLVTSGNTKCEAHNLDGRGWGTCRMKGTCMINDDFQKLRDMVNDADALVFSTPVYFGDISESAKNFLDRWRRCERDNADSPLIGKPAIGIAAAGGRGGGSVNALHNLETYLRRLQFTMFDLVPVTQKSKKHKLDMLRVAGQRLASEE